MTFLPFLVLALGLVLAPGCKGDAPKPQDDPGAAGTRTGDCQACADHKRAGRGWCEACSQGYADGTRTTCSICAKTGKLDEGCASSAPKTCSECSAKLK